MSAPTASTWERRAWAARIVFALARLAETLISARLPINQDDSAAKIAGALRDHRNTVLVAAYLSVIYAVAFVIYLAELHDLLRDVIQLPRFIPTLESVGDAFGSVFLIATGLSEMPGNGASGWLPDDAAADYEVPREPVTPKPPVERRAGLAAARIRAGLPVSDAVIDEVSPPRGGRSPHVSTVPVRLLARRGASPARLLCAAA